MSKHQNKLFGLILRHGPVVVQEPKTRIETLPRFPVFMMDGTIWGNSLALKALWEKGRVHQLRDGRWVARRIAGGKM